MLGGRRRAPGRRGPEQQLRQVVANLLDNAIKYSPDGGEVSVGVSSSGGSVRLSVADRGLGIPAGEQRRIFEKFYRLDPNMTRGIGGTGSGSTSGASSSAAFDGRIWVDSREGQGSTFHVELPVAAGTARRRAATVSS